MCNRTIQVLVCKKPEGMLLYETPEQAKRLTSGAPVNLKEYKRIHFARQAEPVFRVPPDGRISLAAASYFEDFLAAWCLCGRSLRFSTFTIDSSTGVVPVTSELKFAPEGTR